MELPVGKVVKGAKYDDFTVTGPSVYGHTCDLYPAHSDRADLDVFVKVPRSPGNVDLIEREINALNIFGDGTELDPDDVPSIEQIERIKFRWFVSRLVDQTYLYDGTDIITSSIIEKLDGFYTLREVRDAYPDGLDPKDVAWMWRRLLMAIGFAHHQGIIHGNVIPDNILIHPEKHGLVLIDWCMSVTTETDRIPGYIGSYGPFYPPEILKKLEPDESTDIYMATNTMLWMMDKQTPKELRGFAQACIPAEKNRRPHDAWKLRGMFDDLLERMWGPRKFKEFRFP